MKDETVGAIIIEFVGLKPKMYSIQDDADKETTRAKGVKRSTLRKDIVHNDYLSALTTRKSRRAVMRSMTSENHVIYSIMQTKTSLNPFDVKRHLLNDGITSYAYGHCSIAMLNM